MKYVELHHHTTFSYQDGHGRPAQHAALCAEYGQAAMAATEHGNVSSFVELEKACLKLGIKPIFGLEAYTTVDPKSIRKCHLTILAQDQTGYANLMRLVQRSWEEFHQYPTVTGSALAEFQDGLIVLSGCSDSILACSLFGGKMIPKEEASYKRAKRVASAMKELLGDRFYLECQLFPELDRSRAINETYERMGKKLGIPLVATGDVHTLRKGDHEIRATLHAAGRGTNTIAQQMSSWEYSVPDYVPTSDKAVFERALRSGLSRKAAQAACTTTAEIADRCNVTLPKAERFRFPGTEEDLTW